MRKFFRQLSVLLLVAALAGTLTLLAVDTMNHLRLTFMHQRAGSLSFILIGASYICFLLSDPHPWRDKIQGLLLGTGFMLWGSEQFLNPGPAVTVMDSLVVLIFVTDLSWVIANKLKHG
jgi:hypothetical protein